MRFTPKTEEQVKRIFDKGTYRFQVLSAERKFSQTTGKEMLSLVIQILHNTQIGKTNIVNCNLIPDDENFAFLFRHFFYSVKLGNIYESGEITDSNIALLKDKRGIASVGIEKDKSGVYQDKNRILDFIVPELGSGDINPMVTPMPALGNSIPNSSFGNSNEPNW